MTTPFGTCIIDPPWAYEYASKDERLSGYSTGHQYKSITTDDLCELRINELTQYGFLWTCNPFIEASYKVIRGWGMEPVTCLAWVKCATIDTDGLPAFTDLEHDPKVTIKPTYGVGYWFRGCVEPIILFKNPKAKAIRTPWVGLLSENARHSRKPDTLHQLIEKNFTGPYLELFGRRLMPDWKVLGNEIDGLDIRMAIDNLLSPPKGEA